VSAGVRKTAMSERFYADLPATIDFGAVADLEAYTPVPADWSVLLTDVIGSTDAVKRGRYKDVNLIGAGSIAAVLNAVPELSLPYVFGGDGASLVVPPRVVEPGRKALLALAAVAGQQFGLDLRVGVVPVKALLRRGAKIGVRKLQLSPGNDLALFSGQGLEVADQLVKDRDPDNPFVTEPSSGDLLPDLAGLTCRWEPLRARQGVSLTVMLRGTSSDQSDQTAVLRDTLAAIRAILRDDLAPTASPAHSDNLRFRWPPRRLWSEAKATSPKGRRWWRLGTLAVEAMLQGVAERFEMRLGPYDAPRYRTELRANTDFRKYDGLLRLVLDVSPAQADALEAHLQAEHSVGRVVYGTHRADSALMTCLVFSLEQSRHIHFIDGADGGFALAAQAYKKQLAAMRKGRSECRTRISACS
jgi:hypothetical protein